MKRIPVLFGTLLLALAVAVAGCQPSDTPATDDMEGMTAENASFNFEGDFDGPLGVQLWSVREQMKTDVAGTLQKVHDMGFREVELAGTYGMSAEQFRQMLDSVGLEASAMHVSYDLLRDSIDMVLDQAETLGADYVGVAWIPHPNGEPFTEEMARQTAADFNRFGQAAKDRGLQFFYHVHGYEFQPGANGVVPFDVLMQETDPNNVKYEMDVFWVTRPGQDPAALLRKYPDRWELMHIKDMAQGTPINDHSGGAPPESEVPVGSGQINYPEVLKAAQEIGLDKYYIEDETVDPLTNIPMSTRYLESVKYEM